MTTSSISNNNQESDNIPPKKKGWPKGKKRRLLPKDGNAPKGPLSGIFYVNDLC